LLVAQAGAAPQEKVTICHSSNSVANPYNQQTVNEDSIVMPNGSPTGHGVHTGPVYPQPNWGDIIPPFTYSNDRGGTSVYPGMNWDTDGQAIWNGGCDVDFIEPPVPIIPTTTTTLPLSTTTSAPTTTTSRPGSTSTRPGGGTTTTTTVPPPGTTPTTAPLSARPPPITDPSGGVEITPPVEAVVIDPGNIAVDLGPLSAEQRVALEAEVDLLAGTGPNETAMTLAAVVLILLGSFLIFGSRRIGGGGTRHRVRQQGRASSP
jgi:hypothetical protein